MQIEFLKGDIATVKADAIVNAWNCNFIPWFLLLPQGVSKAIKRKAGLKPFNELLIKGPMRPGSATVTGPGRMDCRMLIHVAGLNYIWCTSEKIIDRATRSALRLAVDAKCQSIAFPILGSGTGGMKPELAREVMVTAMSEYEAEPIRVVIVQYERD